MTSDMGSAAVGAPVRKLPLAAALPLAVAFSPSTLSSAATSPSGPPPPSPPPPLLALSGHAEPPSAAPLTASMAASPPHGAAPQPSSRVGAQRWNTCARGTVVSTGFGKFIADADSGGGGSAFDVRNDAVSPAADPALHAS
ncbi:uncharacterized protein LOC126355438 [Schistocerca gregaria]|uniref:uncharacterized protein LOC126355438 n=1 Tax=Schistocerca gregaria TaxID=7010 RepID=UPI00211DD434|nr:uncharacterized protein LOC126355438 [Schistocerca gregaria]